MDALASYELDDDVLALGHELREEQLRRDWIFIEDFEEILLGKTLTPPPPDPEIVEIVAELDELFPWKPRPMGPPPWEGRAALRKALYVMGWRHLPLRTLVNDHGQRKEMWVRRLSWQEIEEETDKKSRREHPLMLLLAEHLGRTEARRKRYLDQDLARARMRLVLQHLADVKKPQWVGQVAAAIGVHRMTTWILLSFLHGEGKIVRYTFNRSGSDAVYVLRKYAKNFEHIPFQELLPINDLDDMDLYEQISVVIKGHTSIPTKLLFAQFPNVQTGVLNQVMDQFGWRFRSLGGRPGWVAPSHPQFESRTETVRITERRILEKRAAYAAVDEFGEELDTLEVFDGDLVDLEYEPDEDLEAVVGDIEQALEQPPPVVPSTPPPGPSILPVTPALNGDATEVLSVLQGGGTFKVRDIVKAVSLTTRRTNAVLDELVEHGKAMRFPVGNSQIYVAR